MTNAPPRSDPDMFAWIFHWPRHAATCGGVLLALLAYGAWSTRAIMTAKPQPTVDYVAKLNALTLEEQPEGENAWPVYQEIFHDSLGYTCELTAGRSDGTHWLHRWSNFSR